jgi:hypothetical protein
MRHRSTRRVPWGQRRSDPTTAQRQDSGRNRADIEERLAEASALAKAGRALEAIDDLMEVNRAHRDPRVEQHLVSLRHSAFAELPASPGRPSWPPTFPDPFPSDVGLPEADVRELSCELLGGAITNHGCLHLRGLLNGPTAERLRDQIEKSFEARERLVEGEAPASVAPWYVPFGPGQAKAEGFGRDHFVRAVDAPGTLYELVELFAQVGVLRAITEYLGERPVMIANKWVLRRSLSGMELTDFHQDGAFLGEGIRTVDCWIALSHCGPGTGRPGLDLLPRRFAGILPTGDGAAFPWSLAERAVHDAAPNLSVCSPVFEPGDALFFDELLPHRTAVGAELGPRYAVESWFVAPSSYPAKHVPIVI